MVIRPVSAEELGIEGKGCSSHGNVRDIDQGLAFTLGEVMAGYSYVYDNVVPGHLLHAIVGNDEPMVLMPDGKFVSSSPDHDRRWQFCDEIAQMFAEQNDGIYFASGFGRENSFLDFSDFLAGLRRCVPNWLKDGTRKDTRTWNLYASCAGRRNATSFASLAQDGKYLRRISVARTRDIVTGNISGDGIVGTICMGDDHITYFGPKGRSYSVTLRVNLDEGFGWRHTQVPSRELSVIFDIYDSFNVNSPQDRAIHQFVHAQNTGPSERRRYDLSISNFDMEGKDVSRGEPVGKMKLSIKSPSRYWMPEEGQKLDGAEGVRQNPPWSTYALLQKLRPVADRVAFGLMGYKAAEEAREKAAYEQVVRDMGLQLE